MSPTKLKTFRLPIEMADTIRMQAKAAGVTETMLVVQLLNLALKQIDELYISTVNAPSFDELQRLTERLTVLEERVVISEERLEALKPVQALCLDYVYDSERKILVQF